MRTVAVKVIRAVPWRSASGQARACGFCSTRVTGGKVQHKLCPVELKDAAGGKGSVWRCPCAAAGHPAGGNPERP
jgi:ferredoxin